MNLDTPKEVRLGEELNPDALEIYLNQLFQTQHEKLRIEQFPSGYSNLTYLISFGERALVLRRPPRGAENIAKGHDMGREYNVLSVIHPYFNLTPKPLAYCDDKEIMGVPFFLMEQVKGSIIRAQDTLTWEASQIEHWCKNMVQTLVNLHSIDIQKPTKQGTLADLGKTEGYLLRQIDGWKNRWEKAKTEDVNSMNFAGEWLQINLPTSPAPTLLHNDFKYDNVVLNPENLTEIKAVLDWEMATVGDPLTDLGIMLSYITEPQDNATLLAFNLKPQNGSLTRQETALLYAEKSGRSIENIAYYYAFGMFKLGVIAQQIYSRYKMGYTQDKRFAPLGVVVKACGELAEKAIQTGKI
jgi:aminoglycoside phosphotransferase (APT) family kinase protein